METNSITKLVATGAIAGFVLVGGMQLAGAQESTDDTTGDDSTTTIVEDPSAPTDAPALDGKRCGHDGDGAADDGSSSSGTTTDDTAREAPAAPNPAA